MNTLLRTGRMVAGALMLTLVSHAAFASKPIAISRERTPSFVAGPQIAVSGAEAPIQLEAVRINTEITGGLAYTQVEMTFYNPNSRVFEGELQFPLLDGQNVVGFALDINGRMREASSVPKARGQEVFEDIARRGVDPGLLQVTQGNNFKLRVYPLFARGKRIVHVRYTETLADRGAGQLFQLPVEYGAGVRSFAVRIVVRGGSRPPVVLAGAPGEAAFRQAGGEFVLEFEQKDDAPKGILQVALPGVQGPSAFVQQFEDATYFVAEIRDRSRPARRALPAEIGILWDASLSGKEREHSREFALLDAYFKQVKNARVRLVRLRNDAEPVEMFVVKAGEWHHLRKALESTPFDGATNLAAFTPDPAAKEYLLFTDGISNFGEQKFPQTRAPVYAINASRKSDPNALRHIAEASGGRYIDLTADSQAEAARKLLYRASQIEDVDARGASDIVISSKFADRGRFLVAGALRGSKAQLRLRIAGAGGTRNVMFEVGDRSPASAVAAKRWAYMRAAELEHGHALNRAEITRIGTRFGIVTRDTSLIVLELARDYAQYDIVPPPELRADVERLRPQYARGRQLDENAVLNRAAQLYAARERWWAQEFPKGQLPAPVEERRPSIVRPETQSGTGQLAPSESTRDSSRPVPKPAPKFAPRSMQKPAAKEAAPLLDDQLATAEVLNLRAWQPDAPYLARFRQVDAGDLYRIYLDERPNYESNVGFYLDVARLLAEKGMDELSLRVLSNLAEIDLENRHILRILGNRLLAVGSPQLAVTVFLRVLELAPYEPQSHRDLAQAYAAAGQTQKAADHLYDIVRRTWHARFPGIHEIAAAELNALIAKAGTELDTSRMDPRLLKNLPLDLRVVLGWDSDNTNLDLIVTDPNGEPSRVGLLSYQGGRMPNNFAAGYGPEEYAVRQAKPGKYKVEARWTSHRQQTLIAPTTMHVAVTTGFGTKAEKTGIVTRRIEPYQTVLVVEFEIPGGDALDPAAQAVQ